MLPLLGASGLILKSGLLGITAMQFPGGHENRRL